MALLTKISTGSSKGNCYKYNSLLLDFGCSFSKIKPYIEEVKMIYITHEHGDHFNVSAVRQLYKHGYNPLFIAGVHMEQFFIDNNVQRYKIVELNKRYNFGGYLLQPLKLYHDVENYGLDIEHENKKGIYLTDTRHLQGISAKDYDFIIVEYNHCKLQIERSILNAQQQNKYTHLIGSQNSHLNFQETDEFIKENAKLGTEILKVHLSSEYNELDYDLHYKIEKGDLE